MSRRVDSSILMMLGLALLLAPFFWGISRFRRYQSESARAIERGMTLEQVERAVRPVNWSGDDAAALRREARERGTWDFRPIDPEACRDYAPVEKVSIDPAELRLPPGTRAAVIRLPLEGNIVVFFADKGARCVMLGHT